MKPNKHTGEGAQAREAAARAATSGRREKEAFCLADDECIGWKEYYGPEWEASPERRQRIVERLYHLRATARKLRREVSGGA
jgi:hypothetical protein